MWAAIHSSSDGPPNTVWTKQVKHALTWFHAFFKGKTPGIVRHFSTTEFFRAGDIIELGTDASPWGLGGWITLNGVVFEHFSSPVTSHDTDLYKFDAGSHLGQQVWEALAILVALRLWAVFVRDKRMIIKVRGDNIGSLTLLIKLRPSSPAQGIVAREIALDLAEAAFLPDVLHTPGVAHVLADLLSREHAPGSSGQVSHAALENSKRREPPARDRSFYRALSDYG